MNIPIAKCVAWFPDGESHPLEVIKTPGMEILYDTPDISFISARNRRRLSTMAKAVLYCAERCCAGVQSPHIVFASRHGEVSRTMEMLADIVRGDEISPTDFSLSVHNATAGILSISKENRSPATALAAGDDSFGWGLVEAYMTWKNNPNAKVLYMYCDDHLPEILSGFEEKGECLHAVALLIGAPCSFSVDLDWQGAVDDNTSEKPFSVRFLEVFTKEKLSGEWRGRRLRWDWRVV